jgi:diguanylate cyclase (GGDEF)-like protein/PAS domain S-box-containing protein
MLARRVRILLVEDRVSDAELVLHELRRAGLDPDWVRVDDEPSFRANLNEDIDLVLADFNLPQFDAMKALAILKETGLDIPFIIVSGSIGDQAAVESMRGGAQDYIFKDNLSRLAAAAKRELEASDQRKAGAQATQESATRLAAIIRSALDAVVSMDEGGRIMAWNPQAEVLFGWTAYEAVGRLLADTIVPPTLQSAHSAGLARYLATGEHNVLNRRIEISAMHRDAHEFPVELSIAALSVEGRPSFTAFIRDITDRKRAEKSTSAHLAVSQALAEHGTPEVVLPRVLEAVGKNLGWDVGQVWLRDEATGLLRCAYRWLGPAANAPQFDAESIAARFGEGEGVVGRVWQRREPVWVDDLAQAPDVLLGEAARREGLTSAAFAPLFAGADVNGVVEFFSHAQQYADPSLVQLMADLSRRMGEFISRAQSEAALRDSESRFRGLFYDVAVGQALIGLPDGTVLAANPAFCGLLGYRQDELVGRSGGIFVDPEQGGPAREAVRALSIASPSYQVESRLIRKDGAAVWASVSVSATFDDAGNPRQLLLQAQDISKRREAERSLAEAQQQLRHRTRHDALTELPNRIQLEERLQDLLRDGAPTRLSLLVLNLDHFKEVNDSFGHVAGDELLKQLGARIQACLRREDLVARVAGDEFGVILAGADQSIAGQLAGKLSTALQRPFTIQGHALAVEASIGIATYPEHGTTPEVLMRRADIALHVAKRTPGTAAVYSSDYEEEGASHLTLMADLRAAIEESSLCVYYQPLVDLKSGQVVRFEALLRWQHPVRGVVPPDQFIPFAEQTGVIQPLTDWVLKSVLNQTQQWHQAGHDLGVAVNISMRNLLDPGLPERIALFLSEIAPKSRGGVQLLSLEITEGVLMADPDLAVERLSRLRGLGIRLSIDDFGTGYSSLAYLSRLPVNEMKIDRSFIMGIADDPSKAAIVRAALDLGHNLRLEVVAEGVEDQRTWDLLFALGCDTAQGYFMARPMPAEAVLPWLLSSPYGGAARAGQAA